MWICRALVVALLAMSPSIAAASPAADTGLTWHSYGKGDAARRYLVYRSADLAPGAPVVVWLHGCWFRGSDPSDTDRVQSALDTGFPALAARYGFAVVFPQQPRSANADECWNWFDPMQQWSGAGEAATLDGLTAAAVTDLRADPKRVYLAGHSAGGAMTAVLGAAYPQHFAALGISAGFPAVMGLDSLGLFAGNRMIGQGVRRLPAAVVTGSDDPLSQPWIQQLITGEWRRANLAADRRSLDVLGAFTDVVAPAEPDSVEEFAGTGSSYPFTVSQYRVGGHIAVDHWVFQGMGHEYPAATMTPALWDFFAASGAS
ncbi:extracellular catalytic domain type 1 short-chain-length polyhydroxyalkanoate depolymerase [Nocardia sp. NPDC004722]